MQARLKDIHTKCHFILFIKLKKKQLSLQTVTMVSKNATLANIKPSLHYIISLVCCHFLNWTASNTQEMLVFWLTVFNVSVHRKLIKVFTD